MSPKNLIIGQIYINKSYKKIRLCKYMGKSLIHPQNYVFQMPDFKTPQHVGEFYISEFIYELTEKDMAKFL